MTDGFDEQTEGFDDWRAVISARLIQIHHQLRHLMSATTDLQAAQAAEAAAVAKLQADVTTLLGALPAAGGVSATDAAAVTAGLVQSTATLTALDTAVVNAAVSPTPTA